MNQAHNSGIDSSDPIYDECNTPQQQDGSARPSLADTERGKVAARVRERFSVGD